MASSKQPGEQTPVCAQGLEHRRRDTKVPGSSRVRIARYNLPADGPLYY